MLTLDQLRADVAAGAVDTVLVAVTDMQGRLQGKRLHAQYFLDVVLEHATESCDYLLTVDVEMNTVAGYASSGWDTGYGDMVMRPDLSTLRRIPWHEGTALVLCDLVGTDGSDVVSSPRQVLLAQTSRLEAAGLQAFVGTELEFLLFTDTYEHAWDSGYRGLTPVNRYNVDYSLLGTARVEPLLRRIRNEMTGAGLSVESAKGECNPGQQEIVFRYDEAVVACDHHTVYKTGAKEIAAQAGYALTFMAKFDEREGNSCHVHASVRGLDGTTVMSDADAADGMSALGRSFVAGQLAHVRELTLLLAPNINSYKRFVPGSFAPTALEWGRDNRTCALRLVGRGASLRLENRIPGGDVNAYLAVAGLLAAGLAGIEEGLDLREPFVGNAYLSEGERVPDSLGASLALWEGSAFARSVFGDAVVDHYANAARVELAAYGAAVTDWERHRGFERL